MVFKCEECGSEELEEIHGEYVCRKCGLVSLDTPHTIQKLHEPESYGKDFYVNETISKDPTHRYRPTIGSYIPHQEKESKFYNLQRLHRETSYGYKSIVRHDIDYITHPLGLNSVEMETVYKYYLKLYKKGITKGWRKEISVAVLVELVFNQYGKFIDSAYIKSVLKEDYKDSSYQKAYRAFKKELNIEITPILPLKAYYDFYKKVFGLYDYEYEILSFLNHIKDHKILINQKKSKFVLTIIRLVYEHFSSKCNEIDKYITNKIYYKNRKSIKPLIEEFFSEGGGFKEL
ncbi:MAG: transcription initiation factor IIB [Methanobrevibacter sp. CfCl-M3]